MEYKESITIVVTMIWAVGLQIAAICVFSGLWPLGVAILLIVAAITVPMIRIIQGPGTSSTAGAWS